MEKTLHVARRFDAPLEHVGGAIERVVAESPQWAASTVDREGGTLVLMLRPGWTPWVDRVSIDLATAEAGTTTLSLVLERSLPWSREAPRMRHLLGLLDRVEGLVHA
jgi:hypothetical protein